jgi:hypothetical protein
MILKWLPGNVECCMVFHDLQKTNKFPFRQFFLDEAAVILVIMELVALVDHLVSHFGASIKLLQREAVLRGHRLATKRSFTRAGGFAPRSGAHIGTRRKEAGLRSQQIIFTKPGGSSAEGAHCDRSFCFKSSQTCMKYLNGVCQRLSMPWCVIRAWLFNNFF